MKTRSPSLLALLAMLSTAAAAGPLTATTAAATTTADFAVAAGFSKVYRVLAVEWHGFLVIRPGDSTIQVVSHLGQPDQKLSSDTWVYRRFQSPAVPRFDPDCPTLLVRFREGRVSELERVNEPAVQWLARQLAAPGGTRELVAQK